MIQLPDIIAGLAILMVPLVFMAIADRLFDDLDNSGDDQRRLR